MHISSITKKLIMAISGAGLFVFLLFHLAMNAVLVFSDNAYDAVCAFLGANWYAIIGTAGLAALVFIHFAFATILTIQNLAARGSERYAVSNRTPGVDPEAKHMMVLGVIIILGLAVHLLNFWSKMQLIEITGADHAILNGVSVEPTNGSTIVRHAFSHWYIVIIYLVWICAIWKHLRHGLWSMMQSMGANNGTWLPRLRFIANALAALIAGGYAAVVVAIFVQEVL